MKIMQLPVIPVCALGTAAALCAGCGKTPAERPNIIIIYADDVGYGGEAALSRAFKAHSGLSPREWKRAHATH